MFALSRQHMTSGVSFHFWCTCLSLCASDEGIFLCTCCPGSQPRSSVSDLKELQHANASSRVSFFRSFSLSAGDGQLSPQEISEALADPNFKMPEAVRRRTEPYLAALRTCSDRDGGQRCFKTCFQVFRFRMYVLRQDHLRGFLKRWKPPETWVKHQRRATEANGLGDLYRSAVKSMSSSRRFVPS